MSGIDIKEHGEIVHLFLNRPNKLNALTPGLLESFIAAIDGLTQHPAKVLVLRGRGRAFSAGADLTAFAASLTGENSLAVADLGRRAAEALDQLDKLKVAFVDGPCVGGGIVLALACDLRWATAGSRFSMPELPNGIPVAWGGLGRLSAIVGTSAAKELVYGGASITAKRALEIGLVGAEFAHANDVEKALEKLASIPSFTLNHTKQQFREIEVGHFDPAGDASIMVNATKDPDVIQRMTETWLRRS